MPLLQPGKNYMPEGADEIRRDFLDDIELEAANVGIEAPIQPGSDWYILGTALGNIDLAIYASVAAAEAASDVLSATGEQLDEIRRGYGLPEIKPAPSTGRIVPTVLGGGTVTFVDGLEFRLPNGLRGKVYGTQSDVGDQDELSVISIDLGTAVNLGAGAAVQFIAPPVNVEAQALVSSNIPLQGGTDFESDDRKRERILNRLQNPPAGGNWSQQVETVLAALGTVQIAFVYPAIGGPASTKIVPVKDFNFATLDFSRALTSEALQLVRAAVHSELPDMGEVVVQSPVKQDADASINVTIPNAVSGGGNGQGWLDDPIWPLLVPADSGRVRVLSVTDNTTFVTTANTLTAPVANHTRIAYWSERDLTFYVRTVVAVTGGPGSWGMTVNAPIEDAAGVGITVNAFISPASANLESYGDTWRNVMRTLGPGQNTADAARLPRSLRHQFVEDGWHSDLTFNQLDAVKQAHPEILDMEWGYRSSSLDGAGAAETPASVNTGPSILVPQHFGVYQK